MFDIGDLVMRNEGWAHDYGQLGRVTRLYFRNNILRWIDVEFRDRRVAVRVPPKQFKKVDAVTAMGLVTKPINRVC